MVFRETLQGFPISILHFLLLVHFRTALLHCACSQKSNFPPSIIDARDLLASLVFVTGKILKFFFGLHLDTNYSSCSCSFHSTTPFQKYYYKFFIKLYLLIILRLQRTLYFIIQHCKHVLAIYIIKRIFV